MQSIANRIIVLWGWRRLLVAFVAGAFSALAFAPVYAFPILWLTFPGLVWLIDGCTPPQRAGFLRGLLPAAQVGWAFGFGFFLAGLWWIGAAFLVDAEAFAWLMPFAVLILPAGLAFFWAFGVALARAFWTEGWSRILVFAVALALAEWLRGRLLTGFPWNVIGYALTPVPLMMQSAALVGLWGLTLAALFIFAAPALLAGSWRTARGVFVAALAMLAAHLAFGAIRLAGGEDASVPGVRLRIVQPSIPQDQKWAQARADEVMARYVDLSSGGKGAPGLAGITHVIWPESAFPFLLTERPQALAAIAALLPSGTTLLTGAARADRQPDSLRVFNSVYLIDERGEIAGAYDKVHLVPFGEYLPLRGLFDLLGIRQLIALPGGFSPGSRLRTMPVPGAPPVGPLICYEVIFPGAVIEPGNRPGWLVNLTNDAWYGDTPGPYQHLLQARVRAVEEGLPLVRAANSGISAIVDPHGRMTASLPLDRAGTVDGSLPASLAPTPYALLGDWIFLALGLGFVAIAVAHKRLGNRC